MELVPNVDQWISQVTKANDGDNRDAANIAIAVEGLADRTFHTYTHALLDTTARPAGNVGTFDFAASSTILFKGSVTFTPTSAAFYSFGGSVGFASTPTFFNGFNATTAGTAAFAIPATFSSTLTASGATTLSGATTTISSATTTLSGAGNRLKLTARSVTRKISAAAGIAETIFSDGGAYITTQSPKFTGTSEVLLFQIPASSPAQHFNVPFYPPDGSVLTNVSVTWTGTCEMSVMIRRNGLNIGGGTPTSTPGTISINLTSTIDRATQSFAIEIKAERTAAANQSATVSTIFTTCSVSEYDEG